MPDLLYEVLIPTIPHRHGKLCALLAELSRQMVPGAGVRVFRDNLERSLPAKNQALLDSSRAEYVSWLDDDDWLAPDFLRRVMEALESRPDQVGFGVDYTMDGIPQKPVVHSLAYGEWAERGGVLVRDITALNPLKRELAMLGRWDYEHDHGADGHWAWQVRQAGKVKTEVFIDAPMYFYRYSSGDSFTTHREPVAEMPPLPEYPWLAVL